MMVVCLGLVLGATKLDIFGKSGGRHDNLIWVRGSPHYFDLRVRGTPTFFTENAEFSPKTPQKKSNMGNFKKSEEKLKIGLPTMVFLIKINLTSLLWGF